MRYERERSAPRRPQVLVVSAPGDPRAGRLADDLQDMGWRIILADTPEMAEDYAEMAMCVVVLRARQWNAPAIAATVRARPQTLIPVLAEPMDLPRGPWTFEPIPMESPRQVAAEVADALDDAARSLRAGRGAGGTYPPRGPSESFPPPRGGRDVRPIDRTGTSYGRGMGGDSLGRSMPNRPSVRVGAPAAPAPAKASGGAGRGVGIVVSLLVVAALVFGGVKFGYPYVQRHFLKSAPTAIPQPSAYTAQLPGPGCDTGAGKGDWQPITDATISGTCQPNGFLLKQSGNYSTAAETFFQEKAAFPRAYQVGVTATIASGDGNVAVGIDVHHQANSPGGHLFAAYKAGSWHAILSPVSTKDSPERLGFGFLAKPAATYTMLVDVQGPTMTFTVNGTKIATITDGTYTNTGAVAFFLYDYGATAPASASFSQFSYTPETDPTLADSDILATATAATGAQTKQPYKATTPGFGCDTGSGQWQPQYLQSSGTTTQCGSGGLSITQDPSVTARGAVLFYGLNGVLPAASGYTLSVQVAVDSATCGGFLTRISADAKSNDRLVVCGTGQWVIVNTVTGTAGTPTGGYVSPAQTYTVSVTAQGTKQSLSINGTQVASFVDPNTTTYAIGLLAVVLGNAKDTVKFSNFSYLLVANS